MNKNKKKEKHVDDITQEGLDDIQYELDETEYEDVSQKDKLKKLRKQLKEEKLKSQEYLTGWQTERASFANYKTNEEKIRLERKDIVKIGFISDLFPVLDSFDMAFLNKEAWKKVDSAWRTGVEYIHVQFMNILEQYGVNLINKLDVPFDPKIHEQSDSVLTEDKDIVDTIASIVQTGYRTENIIIRPAKVKVYKLEEK